MIWIKITDEKPKVIKHSTVKGLFDSQWSFILVVYSLYLSGWAVDQLIAFILKVGCAEFANVEDKFAPIL